jgi:hypothetical protein
LLRGCGSADKNEEFTAYEEKSGFLLQDAQNGLCLAADPTVTLPSSVENWRLPSADGSTYRLENPAGDCLWGAKNGLVAVAACVPVVKLADNWQLWVIEN